MFTVTEYNLRLTEHARGKLDARGVTMRDVFDAAIRPELVESQPDGRERRTRGRLCLVLGACRCRRPGCVDVVVVTVLERNRDQWDDGGMRKRRGR